MGRMYNPIVSVIDSMKRYCQCNCGGEITSKRIATRFLPGHNVYLQTKEEIVARGKRGKEVSQNSAKTIKTFVCKNCGLTKEGYQNRKTCEDCQTQVILCGCGCGTELKADKHHIPKYAVGHNTRMLTFEEHKRRNDKRRSHHKYDDNFRKKMSEKNVRLHKEGKFMNVYGSNNKSSKVELSLKPILEPLGYVSTQDKRYFIGNRNVGVHIPDYVKRDTREIVEVWGTYWHRGENPQDLIDWYAQQGWSARVVWENEVAEFAVNMGGM